LVFERFYRSTAARAMPGSGLGLAIVKQVVLKHGGALRVEDTAPGGDPPGTSIYVMLPGRPVAPSGDRTDRMSTQHSDAQMGSPESRGGREVIKDTSARAKSRSASKDL
jgi:two-component system sensor histidine kinase MprB